MKYWLLKTEPHSFNIDHLEELTHQITPWEGVRNYQARNFIRDDMAEKDLAFFYHSSCQDPGIVGIVKIVSKAYPDDTAFDSNSQYFDAKSNRNNPRWYRVDVQLIKKFKYPISLKQLRGTSSLRDFVLLRKGNRLSVLPVTKEQWEIICQLLPME